MAFDISSFFGGVAKGVQRNIEEQDKEIRDSAMSQFERLKKDAEEQDEKVKTTRDSLKATASVLATYKGINNVGFTQGQIIGMLQNPAVAKRVQSVLDKNADELDQIDFSKLYKVSKGQSDMEVEDYIKSRTTFQMQELTDEAKDKKTGTGALPADKGVFGLPTRARSRAQREFERATGKTVEQLTVMAKGIPDEAVTAEGTLDFSQFKEPETIDKQLNRVGIGIIKARQAGDRGQEAALLKEAAMLNDVKDTLSPEKATYTSVVSDTKLKYANEKDPVKKEQLRQRLSDLVAADKAGKGGEAPSLTEYNSLLTKAERTALQNISGPIKGLVYDRDQGKFVYTGADPVARAKVENARLAGIKNVVDLYSDADGKVSPDMRGALAAAGVQFDQNQVPILSVPVPAALPPAERGTRGPRVPAGQPVQQPAVAAPAGQAAPVAIPMTPDGKIDGSKLVTGQKYTSRDGTVKTWTGSGWQ
jgi:hypothetical protein